MTDDDDVSAELMALVVAEARRVARRLPTSGGAPPFEDLVGFGALGLIEARRRFDPARAVSFEAFARHRVRGAIFDSLREQGLFRRRAYEDLRRQALAHEVLDEPAGDPPTGPDLGLDAFMVTQAIGQLATAFLAEAALGVHPEPTPDAESWLADEQMTARLREAVAGLEAADREVLSAIYDLSDTGDSGARLAERRQVTRSLISRRHRQILDRLRRLLETEP